MEEYHAHVVHVYVVDGLGGAEPRGLRSSRYYAVQGPIFCLIFECESCVRVDVVEHECTLSFEIPLFSRSLAHSVPL